MSKKQFITLAVVFEVLVFALIITVFMVAYKGRGTEPETTIVEETEDSEVITTEVATTPIEETTEGTESAGQISDTTTADELLNDFTAGETTTLEDKRIDAELDNLSDYAKSVAGMEVAQQQADAMNFPFPVEVYFEGISVEMEPGINVVTYGIKNTDAKLMLRYSIQGDIPFEPDYFINYNGPDYSIVYFNKGVPDNAFSIYEAMYYANLDYGYYVTDYAGGSEAVVKSYDTGGTTALTVEE